MGDAGDTIKNDLLIASYLMTLDGWESASKSTYQRILYFAAVLSPVFLPGDKWLYGFSNTFFGPYNNDITNELTDLRLKGFLTVEQSKIYSNRIEERYLIAPKGIEVFNTLAELTAQKEKIQWLRIIVKTLGIYGEGFLSKLVKEDPNVFYQNKVNKNSKISVDSSPENLSKEFFDFIKEAGKERLNIELGEDQEYLLLFFDILYRKYKGGRS